MPGRQRPGIQEDRIQRYWQMRLITERNKIPPCRRVYFVSAQKTDPEGIVVVFQCRQCGECCSSMGEVIAIREERSAFRFQIWFTITGETREVGIDPGKHDLFLRQNLRLRRPNSCPFLRERSGRYLCTVHLSRPDLCRQYACFRILVLNKEGERVGRVIDASRHFTATDPALQALWDREIRDRPIPDDTLFEEYAGQVLTRAGYRVIR
jgi:uncharacterized protein